MGDGSLIDVGEILRQARVGVESASTRLRYEHNLRIFNKLVALIGRLPETASEDDFVAEVVKDFELYCLVFVRLDNGMPMYPAPWQVEWTAKVEAHTENMLLSSRKIGKSGWQTAYYAWALHRGGAQILHYAPTDNQLYSMADLVRFVGKNPYLVDRCLCLNATRGAKGKINQDELVYAGTNSWIFATNLAVQSLATDKAGSTKRGGKGTIFSVDEIAVAPERIINEVVRPMMADVYSKKKLILMGTPDLAWNPNLKRQWEIMQADKNAGTMCVDVWRGVLEGCISPQYVASQVFKVLGIPCPWGTERGICGKRWCAEGLLADPKFTFEDGGTWECDECCLRNEIFVKEHLGMFPSKAGRFFSDQAISRCNVGSWRWSDRGEEGRRYVLAIDVGLVFNRAQIGVFEVMGNTLRLVRMETFEPESPLPGVKRDYSPLRRRLKILYSLFGFKRLYGDATQNIEFFSALTKPEPVESVADTEFNKNFSPVPALVIYCNEASEKSGTLGIKQSGEYKYWEMKNYQEMMENGRVQVPNAEPFWSNFTKEHESVVVAQAGLKKYQTFHEPKGGSIDLVDMFGMAAIELFATRSAKPYSGGSLIDSRAKIHNA